MHVLSVQEVKELAGLVRRTYRFLHDLQLEHPLARAIKAPQVPPALTESLAVHLLRAGAILGELREAHFTLGGLADVVAGREGNTMKIEIKATAGKGFQRLSEKDIAADYLVWIHFDRYFESDIETPITVFVMPQPGKYYRARESVWAIQVPKKVGTALQQMQFSLTEL